MVSPSAVGSPNPLPAAQVVACVFAMGSASTEAQVAVATSRVEAVMHRVQATVGVTATRAFTSLVHSGMRGLSLPLSSSPFTSPSSALHSVQDVSRAVGRVSSLGVARIAASTRPRRSGD